MRIDTTKSPNITLKDLYAIMEFKGYALKRVDQNSVEIGY